MLTDLRVLTVDTARVWWRMLPVILPIYLLGWLAAELTLRIALFAFNFVWVLVASVLILSLVACGFRTYTFEPVTLPTKLREHSASFRRIRSKLRTVQSPQIALAAPWCVWDLIRRLPVRQMGRAAPARRIFVPSDPPSRAVSGLRGRRLNSVQLPRP